MALEENFVSNPGVKYAWYIQGILVKCSHLKKSLDGAVAQGQEAAAVVTAAGLISPPCHAYSCEKTRHQR